MKPYVQFMAFTLQIMRGITDSAVVRWHTDACVNCSYGKVTEAQQVKCILTWRNRRTTADTYLSELVQPVEGTPVTLVGRPQQYLLPLMQLMFEVHLGFIVKSIITLDLSDGRPICWSRLTMTSAVRPEEGGRFMTCSSEARVQFPLSSTWKGSLNRD